jgi:putative transposase
MDTPPTTTKYKHHRFPGEISSHAVWLNFRFWLSFREVEELRKRCQIWRAITVSTMAA